MSSAAVGTHSGAGPLSLMSCVRESSPLQDFDSDNEKSVASKKKFWNPKKWFKRKNKVSEDVVPVEVTDIGKDVLRSRSTSELSDVGDEQQRRRSASSMHQGLSVSHDSVFHSPNSGSDMELDAAQSSSSLSISQPHVDHRLQSELSERLRLRRCRGDTSEDDEGLPHSPCNSPTTTDGPLDKTVNKDLPTKSHSTCSDGSLLSMGSSDMDEQDFGLHSRHSSKLSLHEKRPESDSDLELGPTSTAAPLNHSAAHHRVAVRPKRTHGAPRRKRGPPLSSALPATPEVNEDSSLRSVSPEVTTRETITEMYAMSSTQMLTESQLKCSSLPPGLIAPGMDNSKLNRSKSNAGSKTHDTLQEEKEEKSDKSFFDRIFPRKSAKKKKSKEEKHAKPTDESLGLFTVNPSFSKIHTVETSSYSRHSETKPIAAPRSGPASRQRIQPLEIPASPDGTRKDPGIILPKPSPDKSFAGTSPLQAELENRFRQRQISLSTSPPKSLPLPPSSDTPPQSPKSPRTVISEHSYYANKSSIRSEMKKETRTEDLRSKIKLAGLSSLQQRALSLNDDDYDNGFKSLTDFPNEPKVTKPVSKSHSFKSTKQSFVNPSVASEVQREDIDGRRMSVTKAASLDSVKHLEEQTHHSEFTVELKKPEDFDVGPGNFKTVVGSGLAEEIMRDLSCFGITISGPSHTAVVNVSNVKQEQTSTVSSSKTSSVMLENEVEEDAGKKLVKESQVSITKIQLKKETTQVTQGLVTVPKSAIPEFINKQLNKVEARPSSNIVFSMNSMNSPRIIEEQSRPKTLDIEAVFPASPRKFSKDNLEIIDKTEEPNERLSPKTPPPAITPPTTRFKKNEVKSNSRKSSIVCITPETPKKPFLKNRSVSLDSLKSDAHEVSDKSSQDSLDNLDEKMENSTEKNNNSTGESVVLRRKSLVMHKKDEEPELMKVFARRSLKLKDHETDSLGQKIDEAVSNNARESDKENHEESPKEERKKSVTTDKENIIEPEPVRKTSVTKETNKIIKDEVIESKPPPIVKEPLIETTKLTDSTKNIAVKDSNFIETSEVTLRKPTNNNNVFAYQRAVSLGHPKKDIVLRSQTSLIENRKTDQWITVKNDDSDRIPQDEIITNLTPKSEFLNDDFLTEPKNFNQRKAEWEKRAQQAQKKNVP